MNQSVGTDAGISAPQSILDQELAPYMSEARSRLKHQSHFDVTEAMHRITTPSRPFGEPLRRSSYDPVINENRWHDLPTRIELMAEVMEYSKRHDTEEGQQETRRTLALTLAGLYEEQIDSLKDVANHEVYSHEGEILQKAANLREEAARTIPAVETESSAASIER